MTKLSPTIVDGPGSAEPDREASTTTTDQAISDDRPAPDPPSAGRRAAAWLVTALAGLLVLAALTVPHEPQRLTPAAILRIPLEGLVAAAALLALPARARRRVAVLLGAALGLLAVLKALDLGFLAALGRPFNLLADWVLLDDAVGFVRASFGRSAAVGAVIAALLATAALLGLTTLAVRRLTRLATRRHRAATRTVAALTVAWAVFAGLDVRLVARLPVADTGTSALVAAHARQVPDGVRDRWVFAAEAADDAFRDTPGSELLTALRGKDVLVVFIESYGRSAIEDPGFAPRIGAVLDEGSQRLRAAGFDARSSYLTSSTVGGASWLAHDTLLSGMWIDGEQRHRALLASDRLTLGTAFRRAGWETVGVMPAVTHPWPEGAFFGYQRFYDNRGLGYHGPNFAYAPIPDQYTLAAFERLERGRSGRGPLMAEIALVSSHSPWTIVPRLLPWEQVGDGSIYHDAEAAIERPQEGVRGDAATLARAGYRRAVEYSLSSLISYVATYGDDNLVLVVLGDHQPSPLVTGEGASRDVPISIIARDPAVFERITDWGWHEGLRPGPEAPVWRMDAFRDRFLTAFAR